MPLSHIKAFITGAASGLGHAVAQHLSHRGAQVLGFDLQMGKADSTGDKVRYCAGDVTDGTSVEQALDLAVAEFGSINAAISCAGIAPVAKTLDRSGKASALEIFTRAININLIGSFNVCRLASERMAKNSPNTDGERGVLINTASIAGFEGQKGQSAYAASKGGVIALTLPLARDLAEFGIRVMAIAPGIFLTPMLHSLPQSAQDSLSQLVPFPKRLGQPEEFARMVEHILTNPMLNGSVVRLDGALRLN